jgi:glycosyltransferase involved in cell wall biosynthesis
VRVAVLHPSFASLGGAELLAERQALELQALGHDVSVVSFALGALKERTPRVELVELARPFTAAASPWRVYERCSGVTRRAAEVLGNADCVLAHHTPATSLAVAIGLAARTVYYCHEPTRMFHRRAVSPALDATARNGASSAAVRAYRTSLARDARRRLLPFGIGWSGREEVASVRAVASVWANSGFTRELARDVYARDDIEVVPPFVAERSPPPRRERAPGSPLRLVTRSRLQATKNVETIVRAVAEGRRDGLELELDVVGDGDQRSSLGKLAFELGVAEHVRFHGYVSDAESRSIDERAHVFVLLPFDEPFGMVFVEAALAGHAVLGPDQGGPREILADGGFFAPAHDPSAVRAALADIAQMPSNELAARTASLRRSSLARYTASAFRARASAALAVFVERTR